MRSLVKVLRARAIIALVPVLAACGDDGEPDAYGSFEATDVVVSAQTGGQIERFVPVEGMRLARGQIVAMVDTTQLALELRQLEAQRAAAQARATEVGEQLRVLNVQLEIARRAHERTQRLHEREAATAQQLDQTEREYRVLGAQIEALAAQRRSMAMETAATEARVAQVRDRLGKSRVENPQPGTVLATYARAGEVVQAGQPLYRIAELDTLVLRAYVSGGQLPSVRLGQRVRVSIGSGESARSVTGTISWISPEAEFTPTPIQTRDERADLVYAVKVRVPNPDGVLKIGMPGDLSLERVEEVDVPAADVPLPATPPASEPARAPADARAATPSPSPARER